MKYAIVIPCYNEEHNVELLYHSVNRILSSMGAQYEIIFVNDGSTDGTKKIIQSLRSADRRVKYLSFLTNAGHQKALLAGLRACTGDIVITMDADLQHPPELIPELINTQKKTGAQVVVGKRRGKQKGFLKNVFSSMFYRIFNLLTGLTVQPGISDFRLYTRQALSALCSVREQEPFLRGMVAELKLPTAVIEYDLQERNQGAPSYTFDKSLKMAMNALFRFSKFPVRVAFFMGIAGIALSLFQAAHYLYLRLFTDALVPGQADLMVFISLLGSTILLMLSMMFRLLMQIAGALRNQPTYVIQESHLED